MLVIDQIACAYDAEPVVRDLSLHLRPGEIGCLLGPSGCGKTTALRLVAGFEQPHSGEIHIAGERVARPGWSMPAEKRQVGLVFQDHALFPHLDAAANIAFGLGHVDAAARSRRTAQMLELIGMTAQARRRPHELSGGQQQRLALARALAPRPRLLLLDEPFSNLDVELREKLSLEVRDILKHEGMTALLVTHNQHEAFAVADRVGVMGAGAILQWDAPWSIYHRPRCRRVADFVGEGVFLPGEVGADGAIRTAIGVLQGSLTTACNDDECTLLPQGARVDVLLRPDDVVLDPDGPLGARVEQRTFRGAEFLYKLVLDGDERLLALAPSHQNHAPGETVRVRLDVGHVIAFTT